MGINFVKISDEGAARHHDLAVLPVLVYFRNRFPQIYEGGWDGGLRGRRGVCRREVGTGLVSGS